MRLQSGRELLRIVVVPAGHPASRFHAAGRHGMVGILLVVRPGVPADDRVDLQQPDQEDEAALQLVLRDVAHAVVGIVQVEGPLETQDARDFLVVALVAQHMLADRAGRPQPAGIAHVIVGGADEIAGVAFADELGDRARRHQRDVVGMGLDRQQHLALVRRARGHPLERNVARLTPCRGRSVMQDGRAGQHTGEEFTSLHGFYPGERIDRVN